MSRVGKMAIPIPPGIDLKQDGDVVRAKGPRGELTCRLKSGMSLKVDGAVAHVVSELSEKHGGPLHGVSRAMVANIVEGVSKGFTRDLEIVGTGYRVTLDGKKLVFKLNYDHPIDFPLPEGITAEVADRPPRVKIIGNDKYLVGQVAANIRNLQPPEPYKGKGIKYANEQLRRKAGKSSG